jgi:hypothetical protein
MDVAQMTLGYELRNTCTIVQQLEDGMNNFLNKQKRRSYNDFQAEMDALCALSGVRDVSAEDAEVQAAFAQDPKWTPGHSYKIGEHFRDTDGVEQVITGAYAAAECEEGRHRDRYPNDPTDT